MGNLGKKGQKERVALQGRELGDAVYVSMRGSQEGPLTLSPNNFPTNTNSTKISLEPRTYEPEVVLSVNIQLPKSFSSKGSEMN